MRNARLVLSIILGLFPGVLLAQSVALPNLYNTQPVGQLLGLKDFERDYLGTGQHATGVIGNRSPLIHLSREWFGGTPILVCNLGDGLWLCTSIDQSGNPLGDKLLDLGYVMMAQGLGISLSTVDASTTPNARFSEKQNGAVILKFIEQVEPLSIPIQGVIHDRIRFQELTGLDAQQINPKVTLRRQRYSRWEINYRPSEEGPSKRINLLPKRLWMLPEGLTLAGIAPTTEIKLNVQDFENPGQVNTLADRARAFALCGLNPQPELQQLIQNDPASLIGPARQLLLFDKGSLVSVSIANPSWLNQQGGDFTPGQKATVKRLAYNHWKIQRQDSDQAIKVHLNQRFRTLKPPPSN